MSTTRTHDNPASTRTPAESVEGAAPKAAGGAEAPASGADDPYGHLRLDPGHGRPGPRLGGHRPGRHDPVDGVRTPSGCSVLAPGRPAETLAAMVALLLEGRPDPSAGGGPVATGLATLDGRHPAEAAGSIRFPLPGGDAPLDYLLVPAGATRPGCPGRLTPDRPRVVERYALECGSDWWAADVRSAAGRYRFRAFHRGRFCAEVRLGVPGASQVLPALAAVAIGARLDLSTGEIRDRLEEFAGLPRDFEARGSYRGATLVDDRAPGPRDVAAAIATAREVFGRRPLRVAYAPHEGASGGRPGPVDFAGVDHLLWVDPAGDPEESTRLFAAGLRSSGGSIAVCASADEAIRELDRTLEPGDVLVTLGAGEVGTIADALLRRLSRGRHR